MSQVADPMYDPTTGLKKRILDGIDTDPTAPVASSSGSQDAAPFVSQWDTGASAPSNAPAGQHWDTNFANYVPNAPAAPATAPAAFNPQTANINDSGQLSQLISWAATQPGVNPSVARDPGYWQGAASRFNGDTNYFIQRMFTPEGPPEGSQGAAAAAAPAYSGGGGTAQPTIQQQSDPAFQQFLAQYQAQQAAEAAQKAKVREFLMAQLKNASAPVNESDANIAAPLSAARDETARATDTERTALAERLYAQGGGLQSNALTQGIQQSSERNAGSLSNLRASLISNEYNARRTQLTQLLSQALASSDADSARQIQVQIAALDAALKREGLGVNLAEFGAQLNQNTALAGLNG